MNSNRKKLIVFGITISIILLTVQSVWAAFFTIDTNDTLISDWAAVPGSFMDPAGDITRTAVDITAANVAVQGNNPTDYIYFRVTANDANAAGGPNDIFGAYIDCDDSGNAQTASDVLVTYQRATDSVEFRDPTAAIDPAFPGTPVGTASDGERTDGDSSSDVEWRVLKSDLVTEGCANVLTGALGFQFVGTNGAINIDTTTINRWDSPTAVGLQTFGTSASTTNTIVVGMFFGLLMGTAGYFAHRKTRRSAA